MKKKLCALFLIFVLVFTCTMPAAAATSTYKAAVTAYGKYMKGKSVGEKKIVDVDKNGVPELLMDAKFNKTQCFALCTYNKKTKKVVLLKKVPVGKYYPDCLKYNTSKKQVYFNQSSTGGAKETIVRVKGTKISTVTTFQSLRNYPGFTYTYKVKGKKVGNSTWSKARNSAMKGFKSYFSYY